ncbi:M48 family metallopeptidase [Alphaproteobacteria bacterium LSUCC0684]
MTGQTILVNYGSNTFNVQIEYRERKTLSISVLPDCSIVALAPLGAAVSDIKNRLRKRASWIKRQIDYFNQFKPLTPPRQFVAGETHLYTGRQYRLKFHQGLSEGVKLKGRFFHVTMKIPSSEKAMSLMMGWYKERAADLFNRRLEECLKRFPDKPAPSLVLKRFKSRWGGMSPKGVLTLNPDLVRAPVECIDYVILHELCHIEHPHHGPTFWHLLEQKSPNWQRLKHRLEMSLK